MKRIGIDFGTTNTTLAYFDEASGGIVGYKFHDTSEYVSSAIAYHSRRDEYCIALDAQDVRYDSTYYFYEYYKIGLVENWRDVPNPEHGKTYFDIAKDYLHMLIETYKQDNLLGDAPLDVIVLSVPNTVLTDKNNQLKERLENYLRTEARLAFLVSEPACSCAYYTRQKEPDFEGNLAVVDYGGGTLDVSICHVAHENDNGNRIPSISIAQQYTMDADTNSGAGIAFCRSMVERITGLTSDSDEFVSVVYEFDKILARSDKINRDLLEYYENNEDMDSDEPSTVRLNGRTCSVNCSLFNRTFNDVNKRTLDEALNRTVGHLIDTSGDQPFKIISVGGFSNLICVNKTISERLEAGLGRLRQDVRMGQLTKTERYLAIAYGAALYASREVMPSVKIPYAVSVMTYDGATEKAVTLISEGAETDAYSKVQWLSDPFYVMDAGKVEVRLRISNRSSSTPTEFTLNISEHCSSDSTIYMGAKFVGERPFICVRNNSSKAVGEVDISEHIVDFENRRL